MKLPVHLNAMRAFEASARHQSFAAAAEELHVTPAAVGQLVRSLEEALGISLFHRNLAGRNRLVLTELAERALPDIREGFERLSIGMDRLKDGSSNILIVTVSPAFAAKWLLPRIDHFQSAYPETDVRLDTSLKMLDFVAHGIDIGVRYGHGEWSGLVCEKLMEEEIYPVCSPQFLKQHRLRKPTDLAGQTLIHDNSLDSQVGFKTWGAWLRHADATRVQTTRGIQINNSAAVLQAAIDSHGVALGRSVMTRDDIASKRLVRLFPGIDCPSELAYYVVYRAERANLPRVQAFRDWLKRETSSFCKTDRASQVR